MKSKNFAKADKKRKSNEFKNCQKALQVYRSRLRRSPNNQYLQEMVEMFEKFMAFNKGD